QHPGDIDVLLLLEVRRHESQIVARLKSGYLIALQLRRVQGDSRSPQNFTGTVGGKGLAVFARQGHGDDLLLLLQDEMHESPLVKLTAMPDAALEPRRNFRFDERHQTGKVAEFGAHLFVGEMFMGKVAVDGAMEVIAEADVEDLSVGVEPRHR